ncbi:MAG: helix-turn-helix domain-containing protein [Rhodospirillales bacterium]|jgi:putative transcriptional regulator
MKQKTPSLAQDILQGLENAAAFLDGKTAKAGVHIPDEIDTKSIRKSLGMTQIQFCAAFGFDVQALREWEQGRRSPDRSARILLAVIAKEPEAVRRALAA